MKLGRQPRTFDPRVPHHAALKAMLRATGVARPALLMRCDRAAGLPTDLGVMLNDQLGDCTCAGFYHFLQVVTQEALGYEVTEPDACVLRMYQEAAGYRPGDPTTDRGAVEQDVLRYLLNTGAPMSDGTRHTIRSYAEVDVTNLDDVCEVVQEFGACYIGLSVPSGFLEAVGAGDEGAWDARPSYGQIVGGHAVIVTGFDRSDPQNPTLKLVSWGSRWTMTAAFWHRYVDEAYAIVDYWLIQKSGRTPYGLDLATLDALASALREPSLAAHVDEGACEAARHGVARSPHWPTVEREVRASNPCLACSDETRVQTQDRVQVHHVYPFHYAVALGRPDLELDPRNLICLCETEQGKPSPNHHLLVGHLGNFRLGNLLARQDAEGRYRGMNSGTLQADPDWVSETRAGRLKDLALMTPEERTALRAQMDAELPPDPAVLARFGITLGS